MDRTGLVEAAGVPLGVAVGSRCLWSALRSVPERQRQHPIVEQADMIATEQQSRCQEKFQVKTLGDQLVFAGPIK